MSLNNVTATWRALTLRTKTDLTDVPLLEQPPTDSFSIVALVRGACRIESRGERGWRSATFIAGDVGMTAPGRPLKLRWELLTTQPKQTVHIDLPVTAFERYTADRSGAHLPDLQQLDVLCTPDPVISSMAKAMVNAHANGGDELYAECAVQYLVAHLLSPQALRTPESLALTEQQLATITEYMRAHMAEPVRLADLAREVALSRFHFLRLFTAATGQSPLRFLTELRIDAAKHHLASGDEPVGYIGRRTGFPNSSHFTATFTRHVGCSPTAYRHRCRS